MAAWARYLRGHATLMRELNAELVNEHGLTINDYEVLLHLSHAEQRAMRRIDLARQVLLTASGITRLLDGLERAGWVTKHRCESDARVAYAVLTKPGLEKFEQARDTHLADIHELFGSRFTPEEREVLGDLLGRLPLAETACSE